MAARPLRGEIYDLELADVPGAEDWGRRPGLVVSHDFFNQRLDTVVVVTLTSSSRGGDPGCAVVPRSAVRGAPGLDVDSTAVCHSPFTVPQESLGTKRGSLMNSTVLAEIDNAMSFALDLTPLLD